MSAQVRSLIFAASFMSPNLVSYPMPPTKQNTIRQHMVPRFYLEGFSDQNGLLTALVRKTGGRFSATPENIGLERYFYDLPAESVVDGDTQIIEDTFARLESEVAPVISKLIEKAKKRPERTIKRQKAILPEEQKELLSLYILLQALRTREGRETIIEATEKVQNALLGVGKLGDTRRVKIDPKYYAMLHAQAMFNDSMIQEGVAALKSHIWLLGYNTSSMGFITSDHPVVRKAHYTDENWSYLGLASAGIELALPLSPHFILILGERNAFRRYNKSDRSILALDLENAKYYNCLQMQQCNLHAYGRARDIDMSAEYFDLYPEAREKKRERVEVRKGGKRIEFDLDG